MATALDVAKRSLKLILVEATDSPLEADEYQDFYVAMNRFMASLEANSIRLGYTPVSGPADDVTVPDGALEGIESNMAVRVAPDYGGRVSRELQAMAADGLHTLRRLGMGRIRGSYPPTLPRGTGNEDYPYLESRQFNSSPEGAMWLAGNTQATVIANVSAPVKVKGAWASRGFEVFLVDVTGRIINPTDEQWICSLRLTATATAPSAVSANLILMRNGAERVATVAASLSTARADAEVAAQVTLRAGEYLEVWVENTTDNANITIADAVLEVI